MSKTFFSFLLVFSALTLLSISCGSSGESGNTSSNNAASSTKEKGELSPQEKIIEDGTRIAKTAAVLLTGEVTRQMANGITGAINYCNINAYPLLDSLSKANNVYIKRTSQRLRNPNNIPSESEAAMLQTFQEAIDVNGTPDYRIVRPRVSDQGDHWAYYAPIFIKNPMCLNCHGKVGKDIANKEYDFIKELYPQDKAIDFALGDLRGMWSIQFQK